MAMYSDAPGSDRQSLAAFTLPMFVFLGGLALVTLLKNAGGAFWLNAPEYLVYPLQTLACGVVLIWFRHDYAFGTPRALIMTFAIAIAVFVLWIAPQAFLGFAPRTDGFNPDVFAAQPQLYWPTVVMRFLRLVVVVPIVEEVFWRGFLLRYLINERFARVPIGTFSWFSFLAVTVGFMLVHSTADWPAAAITGALYNLVAYKAKSLTSCILAHAATNLLLGLWIMQTRQWGFW
ncbi:MAG: CAAX prenyl protease-related protein [Chthoniobacterales bacterium]|nr:CAAX prenyl protease-related protein [Chthoniobacterales bacterium]